MKPKFDGYAAQYDAWFMENENVFQSEFRLFEKAIGDISGKRVLSVGCGSGLFESMIDCKNIEGVEPSRDMGAIAQKRGINVIAFGAIEEVELDPPCPEELLVRIGAAGLCHSDLSVIDGEWGPAAYPVVGGHEVIGSVVALGPQARGVAGLHLRTRQPCRWIQRQPAWRA